MTQEIGILMNKERKIRLGIIGTSAGNGHPYSWASIINGYDDNYLDDCPYPAIIKYLRANDHFVNKIKNVEITHIWTQDIEVSKEIANIAFIPNIEKNYIDLIKKVDGILLARDDFENHLSMSMPFLKASIPIYIDKPIATNLKTLNNIFKEQKYKGQIFSCSALKYAKEFNLGDDYLSNFGSLKKVIAIAPKDWLHYSVHIIEPVLKIFKLYKNFNSIFVKEYNTKGQSVEIVWDDFPLFEFINTGDNNTPISIELIGDIKSEKIIFKDTFFAFKAALEEFIYGIRNSSEQSSHNELCSIVQIIENGAKFKL